MRVLIDYRAALSSPSGVGEYAHQLVSGLADVRAHRRADVDVTIFSSSWKDRLAVPESAAGIAAVDEQIPVAVLNFLWHRAGWPHAETLTGGAFDVAHSLHPLLMPSRAAAQVVTVHDLNFLHHPERTRAEIRRDYPLLARSHAARADHIIVPSQFTAGEVARELEVEPGRITVCPPGAPDWTPRPGDARDGYLLFFGTLEPRKNLGALLDAYARLASDAAVPELVVAGRATAEARPWLEQMARAPLAGRVRHVGYVAPADRRPLYEGARMLIQPSYEEGFGLPALEAMTLGVPVVAANRGAAPEVTGDAALLVDPHDPAALACAMRRLLEYPEEADARGRAGVARARLFPRTTMAERAIEAYAAAIARRARRQRFA